MRVNNLTEVFENRVNTVRFGVGDSALTLGGENVLPLHAFDAPIEHPPAVGIEVDDAGIPQGLPKLAAFYGDAESVVEQVRSAAELPEAQFVALRFSGIDPQKGNRSIGECVAIAKQACAAIEKPLAIEGCKDSQVNGELFTELAAALKGENVLFLSADPENFEYVATAVQANGHVLGIGSYADADFARPLNDRAMQLGVPSDSLVMDMGSAAAGYGFEYIASAMDRAELAALEQGDRALQVPIVTPVASEVWAVKEVTVSQDDFPEWGPAEERGIQMEVATAAAFLACGSHAVVLKHPESVKTVSALMAELCSRADAFPRESAESNPGNAAGSATRSVSIGVGDAGRIVGGETVLFRHEGTFVNRTLFAVSVTPDSFDATWGNVEDIDYERLGERMYVEALNLVYDGDVDAYMALVGKAMETGRILILQCDDAAVAKQVLSTCWKMKPLVNGVNKTNCEEFAALALKRHVPLGVTGESLEEIREVVAVLEGRGCSDLVIDVGKASIAEAFANAVTMRRSAILEGDSLLGYPSIVNSAALAPGDIRMQNALASLSVVKYGSIVVMDDMTYAEALPLFGLRQNMFTNPQKPIRVEPGVYSLNGADTNAVCCATVDFALTYFVVSGELERSGVPVNMVITDAGGYSLMTAWAVGKFSAQSIADYFNENGLADSMENKTLILPGKVSILKDELEQLMPEWDIVVGPEEASELVKFMKAYQ